MFVFLVLRSGLCDTDHKRCLRQRSPGPGLVSETAQDHQEAGRARHPTGLGLHEVRTSLPRCWWGSDIPLPCFWHQWALRPYPFQGLRAGGERGELLSEGFLGLKPLPGSWEIFQPSSLWELVFWPLPLADSNQE